MAVIPLDTIHCQVKKYTIRRLVKSQSSDGGKEHILCVACCIKLHPMVNI
jgi:hypothetical protein